MQHAGVLADLQYVAASPESRKGGCARLLQHRLDIVRQHSASHLPGQAEGHQLRHWQHLCCRPEGVPACSSTYNFLHAEWHAYAKYCFVCAQHPSGQTLQLISLVGAARASKRGVWMSNAGVKTLPKVDGNEPARGGVHEKIVQMPIAHACNVPCDRQGSQAGNEAATIGKVLLCPPGIAPHDLPVAVLA